MHRVHVAEQVSVARTPERVAALLRHSEPGWFDAIAAVGWREGETAEALRAGGDRSGSSDGQQVSFALGGAVDHPWAPFHVGFTWSVPQATRLFRDLKGDLVVYPFHETAVLGIFGYYESLEHSDVWTDVARAERTGTAWRPVEVAVRAFLGHLRTALEGF